MNNKASKVRIFNVAAIDGVVVDASGNNENKIQVTNVEKSIFLKCIQDKGIKGFDSEN